MNLKSKLFFIMIILSFGFMFKTVAVADWWDRSIENRPVLPRDGIVLPTEVQPTNPPPTGGPTNPPAGGPTVTSPRQGGPQTTSTPGPTGTSSDDPCSDGKSYTGEYCGWSPRIGGDGGGTGGGSTSYYDPGTSEVRGLSYTSGEEVSLSDIMLLTGLLCLLIYAKSKFAPSIDVRTAKRRSR